MTQSHEARTESTQAEPASRPRALPFEYEDRTDGQHAKALAEAAAALRWTQRRRALGFAPS